MYDLTTAGIQPDPFLLKIAAEMLKFHHWKALWKKGNRKDLDSFKYTFL